MKFHLKHMVTNVKATSRSVTVEVQKRDSEDKFELKADYCLVSIGRRAYTDNLGCCCLHKQKRQVTLQKPGLVLQCISFLVAIFDNIQFNGTCIQQQLFQLCFIVVHFDLHHKLIISCFRIRIFIFGRTCKDR